MRDDGSVTGRWKKILLMLAGVGLLGFTLANVAAYQQARAMTHFVRGGSERTAPPERLSTIGKVKVLFTGVAIPRPENRQTPEHHGMGYESHRFAGVNGWELEAWRIPQPSAETVVILFHGYAAAKDSQLEAAKVLREMGCECWLVDFHGSGGSTGHTTSIGWDEAADVAAAFRQAKERSPGKRIVLLGSSLGAAAILRAIARENVQPDGIILECPFNRLLDTTENRFRAMKLPPFPLAQLLVFWGGRQFGFNGFTHNPAEYATAVRCPVLLLNGATDPRVTRENVEDIRRNLPTDTLFHEFPETGHESYLRKHPEEWRELVVRFLHDLNPRPQ